MLIVIGFRELMIRTKSNGKVSSLYCSDRLTQPQQTLTSITTRALSSSGGLKSPTSLVQGVALTVRIETSCTNQMQTRIIDLQSRFDKVLDQAFRKPKADEQIVGSHPVVLHLHFLITSEAVDGSE